MKLLFLIFLSFGLITASAQQGVEAPVAEAGNDGYAWAGQRSFDKEKSYIVFRLWNEKSPLTDEEQKELESLSLQLSKKKVTLVTASFKDQQDLTELFSKYQIDVTAIVENGIRLRTNHSNYSISANTGFFIFEEKKPVSVCSGLKCIESIKKYFRLVAKA